MINCHQSVLDCHRKGEIRHQFVLDCHRWKNYDFSLPICDRFSQKGRRTIYCHQFVYDLLQPICARELQKGKSTLCCRQSVLDCHRREEIRFVATNLCSIVTEGKKYDLLLPI